VVVVMMLAWEEKALGVVVVVGGCGDNGGVGGKGVEGCDCGCGDDDDEDNIE
jgi:hypothetical protein